ncbi:hypothetical protein VTN00DRAFT_910 [Thermoascus crustaceus]|uniref:uncharacterized protein n=1 Tax=Thermoascus crustaceus TaxID=5088 RepID=UPI003742B71F
MTMSDHIEHDFYEILDLPFASAALSKQQIKVAYHKALLRHHPDKAGAFAAKSPTTTTTKPTTSSSRDDTRSYTVDEITAAYKTLSDPYLRAEYDRSLRLQRLRGGVGGVGDRDGGNNGGDVFHTGLEIVDLEDLNNEDGEGEEAAGGAFWYRGCRCGDGRGFLVTERDLEREAERGEIVIGCRGCSLWMKVLFAVETEDGDGDADAPGEEGEKK